MRVMQVNTTDINGGAATIAWSLHNAYRREGHSSAMVVGQKLSEDSNIHEFARPARPGTWRTIWGTLRRRAERSQVPGLWRLCSILDILAAGRDGWSREMGLEIYNYPCTRSLLTLTPDLPEIVHGHNLHGGYFDLRFLAELSHVVPTCLTLHDEWVLTGHCACAFACLRWRTGCGKCPDLTIPPAQKRDATRINWLRKRRIYARSRLHVATPSRWLANRVGQSMLLPLECRVIPNGVDLSVFAPGDRGQARALLGLPAKSHVLLFVAHGMKVNRFKDYAMIERAMASLAARTAQASLLVLLGAEQGEEGRIGSIRTLTLPFTSDRGQVAAWYRAADVFLHAAHTDNFPNTVLESMACGIPVVATAVGGVPEQVSDGETGILVPPGDGIAMAVAVDGLIEALGRREAMGGAGRRVAERRFSIERAARDYLTWYGEILARHAVGRGASRS